MLLEECLDPLDIQDARFFYRSALAVRPLVLPVPHFPILALVHIFFLSSLLQRDFRNALYCSWLNLPRVSSSPKRHQRETLGTYPQV